MYDPTTDTGTNTKRKEKQIHVNERCKADMKAKKKAVQDLDTMTALPM